MSEHAESPAPMVVHTGPHIPQTPLYYHEILDRLIFPIDGETAKAHTYDAGNHLVLCQYITGKRDGEGFDLSTGQLEQILGAPLQFVIEKNAPPVSNMYTIEAVRRSQRGFIIVLIVMVTGAAITLGLQSCAEKAEQNLPEKNPEILRKDEKKR